jgi:PAS domain S-box-containing protein
MLPRPDAPQPLPSANALWHAIVGSIDSFVIVIDRTYKILYTNRVEEGHSLSDVIGTNALDFVQPEYKDRVSRAYALAFSGKGVVEYEVASWDPAGKPTYYTSRIAPVVENDEVIACMITCLNVQHLKETETSLRADRRALRHLITEHEKERELISCEIHDGLSQDLLGALMLLESRAHTPPEWQCSP